MRLTERPKCLQLFLTISLYSYEEDILNILQQKMEKSGLFVDQDDVFVDLTW